MLSISGVKEGVVHDPSVSLVHSISLRVPVESGSAHIMKSAPSFEKAIEARSLLSSKGIAEESDSLPADGGIL